jgi:hypothetical protein
MDDGEVIVDGLRRADCSRQEKRRAVGCRVNRGSESLADERRDKSSHER